MPFHTGNDTNKAQAAIRESGQPQSSSWRAWARLRGRGCYCCDDISDGGYQAEAACSPSPTIHMFFVLREVATAVWQASARAVKIPSVAVPVQEETAGWSCCSSCCCCYCCGSINGRLLPDSLCVMKLHRARTMTLNVRV